ncbi:ras family-domain-containing protein [Dipodascopsis uninucleata]
MAIHIRKDNAPFKFVVLGACGVGKTSLILQLCLHRFVDTYNPTIEYSYRKHAIVEHQASILEILDTSGNEEYAVLRDQWIREGEGFVLVYSITSMKSFKQIELLYSEIERQKPKNSVPIIVVGNKLDLISLREVKNQMGQTFAKNRHLEFFEVSSKNDLNVKRAFTELVKLGRKLRQKAINEAESHETAGQRKTDVYSKRRLANSNTITSNKNTVITSGTSISEEYAKTTETRTVTEMTSDISENTNNGDGCEHENATSDYLPRKPGSTSTISHPNGQYNHISSTDGPYESAIANKKTKSKNKEQCVVI